jgi:hypothetical protein
MPGLSAETPPKGESCRRAGASGNDGRRLAGRARNDAADPMHRLAGLLQ